MTRFTKPTLPFLLLLISFSALAQVNKDSLKALALRSSMDTTTTDAVLELSVFFQDEEVPDSAIYYGSVALERASQSGDKFRIARSQKMIGVSYDIKGQLDSCLLYLNQALVGFEAIGRADYQSHTLTDKALAYYFRGIYELALRNHLAALELRKRIGHEKGIAHSLLNIGLVYRSRKDYANAVKFYRESYDIKQSIGDSTGMLNSLINVGAAYQNKGQYDSAYYYGLKGLALAKTLHSAQDIVACNSNLAAALVNLKRPDEALHYLQAAEEARQGENKIGMLTMAETYAEIYLQKGDLPKAIEYYQKGLDLATSTNRTEIAEVFTRKLAACFYKAGDYKKAYEYVDQSKTLSDTLLNAENIRQLNELNAVYQTAEKEAQIKTLNVQNELSAALAAQRSRERNGFIIASIVFLAIAFVAYRAFASNKKKKEQLAAQKIIIEKSLGEKEVLLREIHHRVKNNLQIVSSLLSLQSNYIKDEQALDAVKESRNRVQSMSLIHQNLYGEENLTGINVQAYIEQLTDNLFGSYNIEPDKIKLRKEIEPLELDVDTVIPIGLIINELITNCLKYAFTSSAQGLITVKLKETDAGLQLSVYDNGAGLPEGFQPGVKKSFGHKMISAFLQKLKGTMQMQSANGTQVDIQIRNYKLA